MQFLEVKEVSDALTTQQRWFPYYRPDDSDEASRRPPVFEEMSEHLSRHQPQGTHVRTNIRTAHRTPTPESTCSHKCLNSKLKVANSEDSMQPSRR